MPDTITEAKVEELLEQQAARAERELQPQPTRMQRLKAAIRREPKPKPERKTSTRPQNRAEPERPKKGRGAVDDDLQPRERSKMASKTDPQRLRDEIAAFRKETDIRTLARIQRAIDEDASIADAPYANPDGVLTFGDTRDQMLARVSHKDLAESKAPDRKAIASLIRQKEREEQKQAEQPRAERRRDWSKHLRPENREKAEKRIEADREKGRGVDDGFDLEP